MRRHWYLIDDDGWHRINVSEDSWDFWSDFRSDDDDDVAWPAFTQAAVRAEIDEVRQALVQVAEEFDLDCADVTHLPAKWDGGLCLASLEELTLLSEPHVDLDERFVSPVTTERLVEVLETDGAFYGYDPAAGTLTLTTYSAGSPNFVWYDSLTPGPSQALTFHDDGTATDEDPRRFALHRLGQPATSPFLDRYAFVENELAKLGIAEVDPEMGDLAIKAVLRLAAEQNENLG